jgi:hypothetical protein
LLEIDLPDIVAEVRAAFQRYEAALIGNDIATLDELFFHHAVTVRYGATENLYGYDEIARFRRGRPSHGLDRTLRNTVVTTFGRDFATTSTEFLRVSQPRIGRQTQTWVRTEQGWRIVNAHVSLMDAPK